MDLNKKILYLDEKRNIVPREKAKYEVIHIYDDNGDLEKEAWINLKKKEKENDNKQSIG